MVRKIIQIDGDKCDGCGLCANACHEGAIGVVDGKARLLRDDYCDGLGDCLPSCPTGAISFMEREAKEYNAEEVKKNMAEHTHAGCPGSHAHAITHSDTVQTTARQSNELRQWPVQIKLVPANAAFFENADLLISADCAAYAYANFHTEYIRGRITLIGCPKLDEVDYTEKLTAIISENSIKSLMVVRMEVPCCGGIENAAVTALKNSSKFIPWQVVTLTTDGNVK